MINGFNTEWLLLCFDRWTKSPVQTTAWKYRNDFDGFVRWFLNVK